MMCSSISSKIQHDNVLITEIGKVIYDNNVVYMPGCICAERITYKQGIYLIAAVHTDDNTIEIIVYRDNVSRVIHTYEGFLNIINIFKISNASHLSPVVVCTEDGILDVYDIETGRLDYETSNQRMLAHIGYCLNSNVIGMYEYHQISNKLYLWDTIDGFSNRSYWYDNKVNSNSVLYTYEHKVQGAITIGSHHGNGHVVVVLSDDRLVVKMIDYTRVHNSMVPKIDRMIETEVIPGKWLTVPKMLFGSLHAVNSYGILIDISKVSELVGRYFDQKGKVDSCIDGMKVFNVRNIKSARKA